MSARNIITSQNKPDPAINARLYNLQIDGAITYANPPSNVKPSAVFIATGPTNITSTSDVKLNLTTQVYNDIGVTRNGDNFTLPAGSNYLITLSMGNAVFSQSAIGNVSMTAAGTVTPALATASTYIAQDTGYNYFQLVTNRPGGTSFTFYGYLNEVPDPDDNVRLQGGYDTMLTIMRI